MLQLIPCKTCNGTNIEFGNISIDVILSKSDFCEHCREAKTDKQSYFFCSMSCFQLYLREVANDRGTAEFSWKD